jgi:hypothetical protein
MRDYTINKDLTIPQGTVHEYEGKKYTRSYIGGGAFDHEVVSFEKSETAEMFNLWKSNRKKYYKKYGGK